MSDGDQPIQPSHRDWYHRGYLPHFDSPEVIQFLTWRLADSLPQKLHEQLEQELASRPLTPSEAEMVRRRRIEALLDRGFGNCWLRRKVCAEIVRDSFLLEDGIRYELHAWVIMPNHVHLLVQFLPGNPMGDVLDSWKSSTAHRMNEALRRTGAVWQDEFWDRYIRDDQHYRNAMRYIILNPVRAGLVSSLGKWNWWWARGKADHWL